MRSHSDLNDPKFAEHLETHGDHQTNQKAALAGAVKEKKKIFFKKI